MKYCSDQTQPTTLADEITSTKIMSVGLVGLYLIIVRFSCVNDRYISILQSLASRFKVVIDLICRIQTSSTC